MRESPAKSPVETVLCCPAQGVTRDRTKAAVDLATGVEKTPLVGAFRAARPLPLPLETLIHIGERDA